MPAPIQRAMRFAERTALISDGRSHTYAELLFASEQHALLLLAGRDDLHEERVAFLVDPGFDYVKVQWGIWRAGGIAVPLCLTHPLPSLEYVLDDTAASLLVVSPEFAGLLRATAMARGIRLIVLGQEGETAGGGLPLVAAQRRAMILYTSGTTNKPKGVVSTHANLEAQITTLVDAWEWSADDHILCVLPLHHVHGIVNVVGCCLWSGAVCEFLPGFDAAAVFGVFRQGKVNVFMAVPTIYFRLIAWWEAQEAKEKEALSAVLQRFRLMVSGSAALPVSVLEKWRDISGHTLLERYGMTEIGMAISNPYRGERRAGFIGRPLPGVEVRLADEAFRDVREGEPGEILVRGANVFLEYWNKPEATRKEFTADGWFRTGDVAVVEDGYFRIMGRSSVDIIKSGGYKISALEIEEVLRAHPAVSDCAVVGLPDEEWGERVACALVTKGPAPDPEALGLWMKTQMAPYKVPRLFRVVKELPRNAMGKVVKNEVKQLFGL